MCSQRFWDRSLERRKLGHGLRPGRAAQRPRQQPQIWRAHGRRWRTPHQGEDRQQTGITREDFDRLYPKLVAVLRKQGAPHEEARDLAQKALLEAHRGLQKFQHRSELDTWAIAIGKSSCSGTTATGGGRSGQEKRSPSTTRSRRRASKIRLIARDLVERACRAIRLLPEAQQQPLVLLARGFKYREIAEILNISENRVSSLIHQARKKLRHELGARPVDSVV